MYYNTVKVRDEYALYANGLSNGIFKNNIFYSESTINPAVYFSSSGITADYNAIYSAFTYPVYASGEKSFSQYQSVTGNGTNSINSDPLFDTDSTLIPQAFPLDNRGISLFNITDDMNGVTRSTTTPDMGAIEFTVSGTALSGTYTIGSGGNFATFDSVKQAFVLSGISGAVTFNILPGTYTEKLTLGNIPGASATNTVTFQSQDANADSVIWENTGSSSANYAIQLNGARHVQFKHITFKGDNSSYSRKIVFGSGADSVTIDSSKFLGYQGANSNNHASIFGSSVYTPGLKIKNSTFTNGGNYAISIIASSSSSPTLPIVEFICSIMTW